jgi:hypothetical protein
MTAIGFSTTNGLISRLIRWWDKSSVSHAWILVEAFGGQYVMEAECRGFRLVSYAHFQETSRIVYVHELDDCVSTKEAVNRAAEWLGDSYDYRGLFKFLLRSLKFWRGISTPKKMFCSEAVVRFAPELFPGVDPEWATPKQLMQILCGC